MTAFIMQEANEKAQEIKIKANEEFAIEKSKLVRQETDAIDATYEKKFKQATMSQQITRSTVANKTRLKVLGARQELLDGIFEQAQKRLADGSKDKARYRAVLKALALEGFYALAEPSLQVRARKADYAVVKEAIEAAAKEYKEKVGKDVKASIDESSPLPDGGWVISLQTMLGRRSGTHEQQLRRSHHSRRRRQDRDRQHLRRAVEHPQRQRPAGSTRNLVWQEPQPQILRLNAAFCRCHGGLLSRGGWSSGRREASGTTTVSKSTAARRGTLESVSYGSSSLPRVRPLMSKRCNPVLTGNPLEVSASLA